MLRLIAFGAGYYITYIHYKQLNELIKCVVMSCVVFIGLLIIYLKYLLVGYGLPRWSSSRKRDC